ncbi:chemotaxis protein CheW [Gloeocapsopsis dulcis]|uniref:Chemotaxis protein CheW n=1 Tax=Gloeocapsopsis dulcis AAB1 = 1H9 TaxID=1433147 RepID=A0A6N8FSK6_9CHRO|nr:chemotaxis protein CheW [Gloeocapsopsis dulcis]MUL35829.1 chemotaxis protein CheW [Gloeocapsopsis dulcis AAB1 = 1H9]WNN87705.1 chemotaxis protein CheW [Gloeocapsopsis dulcis]
MKNAANSNLHNLKHSRSQNAVKSQKLVVFGMGNITLALPSDAVFKVTNQVPVYGSGFNGVGLAHFGDRQMTIVELHRRFFTVKGKYLIIAENKAEKLYGIPVAAVPTLMDVPLSRIQVLSDSYRHADLLAIATHVCHIPQAETPLTVFLLDVDQLLPSS